MVRQVEELGLCFGSCSDKNRSLLSENSFVVVFGGLFHHITQAVHHCEITWNYKQLNSTGLNGVHGQRVSLTLTVLFRAQKVVLKSDCGNPPIRARLRRQTGWRHQRLVVVAGARERRGKGGQSERATGRKRKNSQQAERGHELWPFTGEKQ